MNTLYKQIDCSLSEELLMMLFSFFFQSGCVSICSAEVYLLFVELLLLPVFKEEGITMLVDALTLENQSLSYYYFTIFNQLQIHITTSVLPGFVDYAASTINSIQSKLIISLNTKTVHSSNSLINHLAYNEILCNTEFLSNPELMKDTIHSWIVHKNLSIDSILLTAEDPFEKRMNHLRELLGLADCSCKQLFTIIEQHIFEYSISSQEFIEVFLNFNLNLISSSGIVISLLNLHVINKNNVFLFLLRYSLYLLFLKIMIMKKRKYNLKLIYYILDGLLCFYSLLWSFVNS